MESFTLSEFTKCGSVVTNTSGVADVVFTKQLPYGLSYVVLMTCEDPGEAVIAYPSKIAQTGFTITTKNTHTGGGGYVIKGSVIVHWLVVPQFNS